MHANRVAGENSGASNRIKSAFGIDLSQWGNLSPEQVREMAMRAKQSKIQKQLVEAASRHFQEFLSNQKEIERLTQEALSLGLKTDVEIRGYINKAAIASAKYDAKIMQLEQQLKQEQQMIRAESLSEKALSTANFQQRLLLLRYTHQARLQAGNAGFQQQLAQARELPALAAAEANNRAAFNAYINARDYNPYPATNGSQSASSGGGFFGRILNFLTGK